MDEQTRINAAISYFFLGPLFLLARSGTPLADPYVKIHAKRASSYMLIALIGYVIYFLLKPYITLVVFGISLHVVILSILLVCLIGMLAYSAYKAFQGGSEEMTTFENQIALSSNLNLSIEVQTEAEKIRIIGSFIPLLGIWIASKHANTYTLLGRRVGTFLFVLVVLVSYLSGSETGLSLVLTLLTIVLLSYTGVSIFINNSIPFATFYQKIPNYRELLAHATSLFIWGGELFKVLSGKEAITPYREIFGREYLSIVEQPLATKLPLPSIIIGIPLLNILFTPFLFGEKNAEHRGNILQGLMLSILLSCIWWFDGINSGIQSILFISALHLMLNAGKYKDTHAPVIDIIFLFSSLFKRTKTSLEKVKEENKTVEYPSTIGLESK